MTNGARLRSGLLRAMLGAGTALSGVAIAAIPAAQAITPPTPITFEAGPLGNLTLSGGMDGMAYALTGTGTGGQFGDHPSAGFEFLNGLIELQKTSGLVQFTLQAGARNTSTTLGTRPGPPSVQTFVTGPLIAGYVTLAPTSDLTISAGHIPSLEGYESAVDWTNANLFTTSIYYVENSNSTGITATYTKGPVSGTLTFGDGFDTQQWNFLQGLVSVNFNSSNSLTVFGATNLGTTGAGAHTYGSASTSYSNSFVGSGPGSAAPFINSTMIGAYYSVTLGNLTLTPEVQYVYAKPNSSVGLDKFSSNFGAALFASYQFGKSPYSLGAWVEYFSSNGPDNWFINPGAQGVGMSIAPTWQKGRIFVRGDVGVIHLTNMGDSGSSLYSGGYGSGSSRNQATFILETGVLF